MLVNLIQFVTDFFADEYSQMTHCNLFIRRIIAICSAVDFIGGFGSLPPSTQTPSKPSHLQLQPVYV